LVKSSGETYLIKISRLLL